MHHPVLDSCRPTLQRSVHTVRWLYLVAAAQDQLQPGQGKARQVRSLILISSVRITTISTYQPFHPIYRSIYHLYISGLSSRNCCGRYFLVFSRIDIPTASHPSTV
ncbi:hypothetical protein VTL71DRAFT_8495 [Oculimacula yallundae]|uniref:Uncharacterized protein n=1 Tax=Oculimacula yallundae TaxID=86028 RepID=A0ABR4D010_9HELO